MTCIYLWGIFMGWESSPWQVSIKENVLVFPPKGVVMVVKRSTAVVLRHFSGTGHCRSQGKSSQPTPNKFENHWFTVTQTPIFLLNTEEKKTELKESKQRLTSRICQKIPERI